MAWYQPEDVCQVKEAWSPLLIAGLGSTIPCSTCVRLFVLLPQLCRGLPLSVWTRAVSFNGAKLVARASGYQRKPPPRFDRADRMSNVENQSPSQGVSRDVARLSLSLVR